MTPRRPRCPWLEDSPELQQLLRDRDEAYRAWRFSGTDSDRYCYRRLRNRVKGFLAERKRDYLCTRMLTDRREFWRGIRDFALRPGKGGGGAAEEMPPEQADEFNRHFAAVGPRIAAELAAGNPPPLAPRPPCVTTARLRLRPATLPELSLAVGTEPVVFLASCWA